MVLYNPVPEILAGMKVVTKGHFVYASGMHGSHYVAKDMLYINPRRTSDVCQHLAREILAYCEDVLDIDQVTVAAPVVGGVALSQWVTYHLLELGVVLVEEGCHFKAFATFADKDQETFIFKRGYDKFITNADVVVVEDILTTGNSAKATVDAVRKAGGNVVMVAAICNRGRVTAEMLGVPHLYSAYNVDFETFDPRTCPLCGKHVPVNIDFGHGAAFLKRTQTNV